MKSFESLLFALPFVQSVHVVLPGVEFRPEPHARHAVELTPSAKNPTTQSAHDDWPATRV